MIRWWVVVRHSPDYIDETGKTWPYPPEGFPISAFASKEQAELFAKASCCSNDTYEAIEVVRAA